MKTVYISPSDQTANSYMGVKTTEAIEMRETAKLLVKALKRNGFNAVTNTNDGMVARVKESNKLKADLHICLHSNAIGSKSQSIVAGTRMFAWDTTGKGYKACKDIYNRLAPLTPGTSENIKTNQTWYEMKNANAPTVYIEVEFHDNPVIAKWIVEHKKDIAEAICHGICDHYGVKYNSEYTYRTNYTMNIRRGAKVTARKNGKIPKGTIITGDRIVRNWLHIGSYKWVCISGKTKKYLTKL